jgi:dinuclear metal center YbgI/SA1388 family protein
MTLTELDAWLKGLLNLPDFEAIDASRNGLQVARRSPDIRKVASTVDASLETFRRAVEWGADMLLVHHGILWDGPQRIVGGLFERIRFLVEKDLALYAVHLPLDAHREVGNNICIARLLGLADIQPFGSHRGIKIGVKGILPSPLSLEEAALRLAGREGEAVSTLPFGPEKIRSVGIVSGGAAGDAAQAVEEDLDLFVTGEAAHGIYHHCLEARIHVIFAGHYHSESFGVRLLAERLARDTGLETTYIDVPTGL